MEQPGEKEAAPVPLLEDPIPALKQLPEYSAKDIADFFEAVKTQNWLLPELGDKCIRVENVDGLSIDTDRSRHGLGAYLYRAERSRLTVYETQMDHLSNLASLGQLQRGLKAAMLPLPENVAAVVWHCDISIDEKEPPARQVFLHVIAYHRYASKEVTPSLASEAARVTRIEVN